LNVIEDRISKVLEIVVESTSTKKIRIDGEQR